MKNNNILVFVILLNSIAYIIFSRLLNIQIIANIQSIIGLLGASYIVYTNYKESKINDDNKRKNNLIKLVIFTYIGLVLSVTIIAIVSKLFF
ncbi:membrane associated rhomboid family serine protease [Flammeovirga kamogawensis]|nr:membrane associated rhomboid family serine protease [Flammeovirga kamogawensis]